VIEKADIIITDLKAEGTDATETITSPTTTTGTTDLGSSLRTETEIIITTEMTSPGTKTTSVITLTMTAMANNVASTKGPENLGLWTRLTTSPTTGSSIATTLSSS